MKKFKITVQQRWYNTNETNLPKVVTEEIECDGFDLIKDKHEITEENLNYAKTLNSNYKVGDIHYDPLKEVLFYNFIDGEKIKIKNVFVFGDSKYKLFESINDEWVQIDNHSCNQH